MVTAIVLIHADRKMINETAQELVKMDGISEVYSVAGQWDLAALIRVKDNELLAETITNLGKIWCDLDTERTELGQTGNEAAGILGLDGVTMS